MPLRLDGHWFPHRPQAAEIDASVVAELPEESRGLVAFGERKSPVLIGKRFINSYSK